MDPTIFLVTQPAAFWFALFLKQSLGLGVGGALLGGGGGVLPPANEAHKKW